MAMDELLLDFVREQPQPTLIVRTYQWDSPTLSLGVHQSDRDLHALIQKFCPQQKAESLQWVRRPTGGRAILHGQDISFAFISNEPKRLQQSLKQSYQDFTSFIEKTFTQLGIDLLPAAPKSTNQYASAASCFETHTPSDLLNSKEEKICGSAQLRRAGGVLQHGSAFLKPYGIAYPVFHQCMKEQIQLQYPQLREDNPWASGNWEKDFQVKMEAYQKESGDILTKASTTAGSH
jgi:lipoate-protein ligase A